MDLDRTDHQRALELLKAGQVQAGARLLGEVAGRTADELLHSNCTYNLGEVLEQLGQTDEAYCIYYLQAHKPLERRNQMHGHASVDHGTRRS